MLGKSMTVQKINVGMSMPSLHRTGETDSGGKRQEELIQLPDMSPS